MKVLALFDFDGTLTKRDSLLDFIHFVIKTPKKIFGAMILSPIIIGYLFKIVENDYAKERVLHYFFANMKANELYFLGQNYALNRLPSILRSSGIKQLKWHIEQGHDVTIVSASPVIWLKAWTDSLGVKLIATILEEKKGRFTGRYQGLNCYGEEKVRRIKEQFDLNKYDKIYAYGDTPGDKAMLKLADKAFYKPFEKL